MPPKMSRRGSIALNMLASMSLSPKLQSVLSSVNPPSEDAAFQIVDSVLTAAIWKSHLMTLDDIARECGARSMTLGLVRLLAMTNEYIARDEGEGGPNTTDLEGDEPIPCEIDARARGRVATLGWNAAQPSGDAMSDDMSDDFLSCASSSAGSSNEKRGGYTPPLRNRSPDKALEKEVPETLAELPLARVLGIKAATGGNVNININSTTNGKAMTARSEGISTARSLASSAKLLLHPAMAGLFDMADRRRVGWLNVTDLQIFLEYHGHKQWANPAFIRVTLVDLGISKGGNEPIKPHHFMRFLLFLMQKNPLMEFAARPLPPDQLSIGVPEQARELAGILKEVASRTKAKPVAARRRLNRALTSQQLLKQPTLTAPAVPGALVTGGSRDGGAAGGVVAEQWDLSSHQIAPQVSVRDLVVSRRPSTAPVVSRRQQQQHHELSRGSGKRVLPRDGGGGREKGDLLETFLHLDHSVQASLIETVTDVRPGVVVQEMGFSSDGGGDASQTKGPGGTGNEPRQVVLRVKAGPAELQVPGRLSRSAYKALSRSRTAPEMPMGLDRPSMTSTAAADRGTAAEQAPQEIGGNSGLSHPLKSGVAGMRGGIRSSTAPLGLHGFFGVKDGPDPRLIGASKISAGYDGDEDDTNDGREVAPRSRRFSRQTTGIGSLANSGPHEGAGFWDVEDTGTAQPFFEGEDVGCSSIPGGGQGSEPPALMPRGTRPAFSANGATRARVSSPGLGARGDRRGGRAVAAW